ncbi:hypothetical protein BsWGS_26314 [Bradybaena similaris]
METGRGRYEYCQRARARKPPDTSNNKEESCNNSFENGTDSAHANVSKHQSMVSLSSGTLDILELAPKSLARGKTHTGHSGLRTRKKFSRKLVVGRNASPRKQRQRSSEQHRLHPKRLRVPKRQQPLSSREPNRCQTTPDSLTSCSKTIHLSGSTSKFPKQRKPASQTQFINTPSNTILANNKTVPASPKPSRYQLTSPRPSKSKIPKRVSSNTAKTCIPKSNEKYTKGNTNLLPLFDTMSINSVDLNKRHTTLDSPPGKTCPQSENTSPSLSPFRNVSFNSSKTSKCTGRASTVSQASKLKFRIGGMRSKQPLIKRPPKSPQSANTPRSWSPFRNLSCDSSKTSKYTGRASTVSQASKLKSRIGGMRSKQPLIQRPKFHGRTKKASKNTYQFGKKKRNSKMTAARRRKLSLGGNHARLCYSLPDNLKSLSTERRENATKPINVPAAKVTTKPVSSAKRRRSRKTSQNKGLWQKKTTSMSAKSKPAAGHEKESAKENPSSPTVSPKKKLTRASPKACLSKNGPGRSNKARLLRGTRTRPCKSPKSKNSPREQSVLKVVPRRPRACMPAYSRSGVGFNSLGVYKSHNLQRSPQKNVQETSFLFKFQSKQWMLKPGGESAVQSGAHGGASNTERRDCFAAWKLTKHQVLQSCSSEDLLIMNNAVKQSPPHGASALSCCTKLSKTQNPQSDAFLDHQKQIISLDHQKQVNSLDHQKQIISLDHQKQINSLDHQKPDSSLDHQKPVTSLDHQKPNLTVDNQKAASIRQETRLYVISGTNPLLSLKVQSVQSITNVEMKSHSEYTSSTDTDSTTSKWSLGSSICSSTSPLKRQYSSMGTSWPVKSWSCIYCLPNQRRRKKRRGCLISSKTELENKKGDNFKYGQVSRNPGIKAKPNRLTHQREHFRLLKTSLEFSNSKQTKNKQGKRYHPVNSGESPPKFVKRTSYKHGPQLEGPPSALQSKKPKPRKSENRPLPSKKGRLGTCTVEPEDVIMKQLSLVPYNSSVSQKQTLQPSWSPSGKPKQDTSSTVTRLVRRESLKRLSTSQKWGLATQPTRKTKPPVGRWRVLPIAFVLLLVVYYYFGFSSDDDILDLS